MDDNEKIFKWLNPNGGWHDWEKGCLPAYPTVTGCKKCGIGRDGYLDGHFNPQYDTDPAACLALLTTLVDRGYGWDLSVESAGYTCELCVLENFAPFEPPLFRVAESLPKAVVLAVVGLIGWLEIGKLESGQKSVVALSDPNQIQ